MTVAMEKPEISGEAPQAAPPAPAAPVRRISRSMVVGDSMSALMSSIAEF